MRATAILAVMLLGDLLIGQDPPPVVGSRPSADLLIGQTTYSILWFSDPNTCTPCRELVPTVERMKKAGYPIVVTTLDDPRAGRYGVDVEPVMLVLADGREEARVVGRQREAVHCAAYNDVVRGKVHPSQQK